MKTRSILVLAALSIALAQQPVRTQDERRRDQDRTAHAKTVDRVEALKKSTLFDGASRLR